MKIRNKTTNRTMMATVLALAGLTGACATTAPAQLVEARSAYTSTSSGLAATLSPTELYDAKKVLDKANLEFDQNGDTNECRDLAYIAQRKLALAEVKARTEQDRQKIAEAVKAGVVVRDVQAKNTQAALVSTREELKQERQDNSVATNELRAANTAQGQALDKTTAQLDTEKQARLSAEAKLAGAMKDLADVAAVKQEARGVVITLSGSVLFASGKYALLNTAMTKLDQVADGAPGAGRRQTHGRRRSHRQSGLGQGQSASVTEPGKCRARLSGLPRGRLGQDHGGGPGLEPADRRQHVGREPRQQPARRDRRQHGPPHQALMPSHNRWPSPLPSWWRRGARRRARRASERLESSSAAILAAEDGGAARSADAEMYLRLAKDQFAYAQQLPNPKDRDRVDRLLRRAQVDAELSLALAHGEDQKAAAQTAIDKVTKLNREAEAHEEPEHRAWSPS